MTYSDAFSKLWTTLDRFNRTIDESDKLDEKALQIIQNYLSDRQVTTLKQGDEDRIQHPLKELQLLNNQATLARVKSTDMKQINRQIIGLAEMLKKYPEQTKKDAYFILVKLEVCFSELLSEEAVISGKQWQKFCEEKMEVKVVSEPSDSISRLHAERIDPEQSLIIELMNAPLSFVIEYFRNKNESFVEHFTEEFLDLLKNMIENPDVPVQDEICRDVKKIIEETAETCNLSADFLISQFRYSIIGFHERTNQFSMPLLRYITNTRTPTLMEFNQTNNFSSTLLSEEVGQFQPLFKLYCDNLFTPQQPEVICTEASDELQESSKSVLPEATGATAEITTESDPVVEPLPEISESGSHPSSSKEKLLASPHLSSVSVEKSLKSELPPPPPPIDCESDLKFVWITPNIEDHYNDYLTLIKPRVSIRCTIDHLKSYLSDDNRIFLCVSATQARDLLSRFHEEPELYLVYVLCQNKAEEDQIQREIEKFKKIRIATSNRGEFLSQLAIDVVPSFIELGDITLKARDKQNARRWYNSARTKIITYGGSVKDQLLLDIDNKLQQCS